MIQLTRLNHQAITVNSDLIKFIEQAPDTVITLVNGEKILVLETSHEILSRIVTFRRTVLQGTFPAWGQVAQLVPNVSRRPEQEADERPGR